MSKASPNEYAGRYFALLRLIARWRGASSARSEGNWWEACLGGVAIYVISYLFATNLLLAKLSIWQAVAMLPILLLAMWIFWLIVLYLNSLVVKACWACGLCTDLPRNRIQSVLIGILTTAFAAQLMTAGPSMRWVGAIWMIAVAFNLIAALLLALLYDERS